MTCGLYIRPLRILMHATYTATGFSTGAVSTLQCDRGTLQCARGLFHARVGIGVFAGVI